MTLNPSAPDQLNLAGISEFFTGALNAVGKTGNWLATNEKPIVNLVNAVATLRNQTAATAQNVNMAYQNNLRGKALPVGQTSDWWSARQADGAYAQPLPSWLLPVGLGIGALVLVMLTQRNRQ
ncbi:MAG TPA: hypothetical protein VJ549_00485 [Geothrix sp.]|nr:hypothetical protein [Geothrix sp.]